MATTYDKASLVMIPSGYKDDKLYSIKPTDGSGDFTFSRDGSGASPATRVNASGYIEKGRENVLLQSNTFDTTWTNTSTTETSGQADKDGGTDAWLITATGTSDVRIQQTKLFSGVQTFSVYAKAGTADFVELVAIGGVNPRAWFDLNTGAVGTFDNGAIDANIEDVGSGWYRCSLVLNESASQYRIYVTDADNSVAVTNGATIYIQDAQLEQGLVATDYIETTTTAVSAGLLGDMPRLDYSGGATCPSLLLEPSRVNLLPQSEYYGGSDWTKTNIAVTNNATTSPEGVQNAALVYPSSSSSTKWGVKIEENKSGLTNSAYTNSVYLKSNGWRWVYMIDPSGLKNVWFDLQEGVVGTEEANATGDIEPMGDGWYKCIVYTHASTTTYAYAGVYFSDADNSYVCTASGTNGVYMYGFQSEAGSYPTSYIPTYGSAASRAQDQSVTASPSTSLFGQTEGTIFIEFEVNAVTSGAYSRIMNLKNSGGSNQIYFQQNDSRLNAVVFNGSNQFSGGLSSGSLVVGQTYKAALAYKNADYAFYFDGTQIATGSASGLGTLAVDRVDYTTGIGNIGLGNECKQSLVFNTRLTNAELAALTA